MHGRLTTTAVGIFCNMRAELLIRRRVAFGERDFAELVVWRVPTPVPPTDHGFKYRLVYVVDAFG